MEQLPSHNEVPKQRESVVDHLMTYDEYNTLKPNFPYYFELEQDGQRISYFGANHTYNPDHAQVPQIKKEWNIFLSQSKAEQSVVLIEGGTRTIGASEAETLKRSGEPGLATYLAKQAGIAIESPEPPRAYEVAELLKHFPKESILYYYFARAAHQWTRTDMERDFLTYVQRGVSDQAETLGFTEDLLSTLSETHQKMFGTTLDLDDLEHFERASDPTTTASLSNQVARATSILRDRYILKEIEKKWQEGKSLFIIYGATHAVMQEPALRHLVSAKKSLAP